MEAEEQEKENKQKETTKSKCFTQQITASSKKRKGCTIQVKYKKQKKNSAKYVGSSQMVMRVSLGGKHTRVNTALLLGLV